MPVLNQALRGWPLYPVRGWSELYVSGEVDLKQQTCCLWTRARSMILPSDFFFVRISSSNLHPATEVNMGESHEKRLEMKSKE